MNLDDKQIEQSIEQAELNTSGEIRVHVSEKKTRDVFADAKKTFEKLDMAATQEKNGVLIYISIPSHQFSIIGDTGIHDKVHQEFWDEVRDEIASEFKKGDFTKGICDGVLACGEKLKAYFPRQSDDQNELDNQVTRD